MIVNEKNRLIIPEHELEISASRSGGAGGQHVNKTSSRITVRWNIPQSNILTPEQRERLLQKLQPRLTSEGDLIIHNSTSRSQHQNKELAIKTLHELIYKALRVPKKRMKTKKTKHSEEARLHAKSERSLLKKMRGKKIIYD
jgi:ribosome-associated protein